MPTPRGPLQRGAWMACGFLCVAIGSVGVVVPGLPTTVFFIGAAASFARSSPRLERWVLSLPKIGPAVRDYRAGLGMPVAAKVVACVMIVVFVSLSAIVITSTIIRVTVLVAGVVGLVVVLRVPTHRSAPGPETD